MGSIQVDDILIEDRWMNHLERKQKQDRKSRRYTGKGVRIKTKMVQHWQENGKKKTEKKKPSNHHNTSSSCRKSKSQNPKEKQKKKQRVPQFIRKKKKWGYFRCTEKDTYDNLLERSS